MPQRRVAVTNLCATGRAPRAYRDSASPRSHGAAAALGATGTLEPLPTRCQRVAKCDRILQGAAARCGTTGGVPAAECLSRRQRVREEAGWSR